MPLASLLGLGTEEISLRVGQTLGGLLSATLGNAVELIVAIIALVKVSKTLFSVFDYFNVNLFLKPS